MSSTEVVVVQRRGGCSPSQRQSYSIITYRGAHRTPAKRCSKSSTDGGGPIPAQRWSQSSIYRGCRSCMLMLCSSHGGAPQSPGRCHQPMSRKERTKHNSVCSYTQRKTSKHTSDNIYAQQRRIHQVVLWARQDSQAVCARNTFHTQRTTCCNYQLKVEPAVVYELHTPYRGHMQVLLPRHVDWLNISAEPTRTHCMLHARRVRSCES